MPPAVMGVVAMVGASTAAGAAGVFAAFSTGAAFVGGALTVAGAITGNSTLTKIGAVVGLAGVAAGAFGALDAGASAIGAEEAAAAGGYVEGAAGSAGSTANAIDSASLAGKDLTADFSKAFGETASTGSTNAALADAGSSGIGVDGAGNITGLAGDTGVTSTGTQTLDVANNATPNIAQGTATTDVANATPSVVGDVANASSSNPVGTWQQVAGSPNNFTDGMGNSLNIDANGNYVLNGRQLTSYDQSTISKVMGALQNKNNLGLINVASNAVGAGASFLVPKPSDRLAQEKFEYQKKMNERQLANLNPGVTWGRNTTGLIGS